MTMTQTLPSLRFVDSQTLQQIDVEPLRIDADWCAQSEVVDQFLATEDAYLALRIWLEKDNQQLESWSAERLRPILLRAIRDIDERLNNQVNAIIHHPHFQQLEASWRGLEYLTAQIGPQEHSLVTKVKLISISWQELCRDVSRAIEFDQSELFKQIYSNEFNMPGGEPFGMLVGDYRVSHKARNGIAINDLEALRAISLTAAAAFAPFVTGADPSMLGVDYFSELASVRDIAAQFSQDEYLLWRKLRSQEDSRFLGIAAPNILMREPYQQDGRRQEGFMFVEQVNDPERDYLWGNAAYGVASVAVRAFRESGWFSQIRGLQPGQYKHGLVFDLPGSDFKLSRHIRSAKPPVNLQVGDRLEKQLSDSGFIPVSTVPHTEHLVLYSNASVNLPKHYDSMAVAVNARLSSMLQYVLCVSRFAHYLKIIGRDRVGRFDSAHLIERDLQRWLHRYTTASDEASDEIRARYPLNEASIQVKEQRGKPGHYYSIIHLRPHFQLDQMVSSIRLITELSPSYHQAG
ncbi:MULTISPECIES: type VI secretion system contractile sheath large subunit [unclassified Agarivorans]|uniref:type VI secretion system contractile sheath large subunit n=1 Tax=unclassified Agarivorans TaxID=2636026 RepID=UPI003D7D0D9A